MNFIDKITGNDMKRELKAMELRVKVLPKAYQEVWVEIQSYLWPHSNMTGRNLMPILGNILDLLEETSADGSSIEEVFGGDVKGFVTAMAGGEGAGSYRDKWRQQLNDNVARKLGLSKEEEK